MLKISLSTFSGSSNLLVLFLVLYLCLKRQPPIKNFPFILDSLYACPLIFSLYLSELATFFVEALPRFKTFHVLHPLCPWREGKHTCSIPSRASERSIPSNTIIHHDNRTASFSHHPTSPPTSLWSSLPPLSRRRSATYKTEYKGVITWLNSIHCRPPPLCSLSKLLVTSCLKLVVYYLYLVLPCQSKK